jgi:hypothetical protein
MGNKEKGTKQMNIGDRVYFTDKISGTPEIGTIRKLSADGTKALVDVSHKYSRQWMKIDQLERINND